MTDSKQDNKPAKLEIKYQTGDLLSGTQGAVIVHSCNCSGSWGAGIARTLKTKYPAHFKAYQQHCKSHSAEQLLGTTLLLWPEHNGSERRSTDFIACVFTRAVIFSRDRDTASEQEVDSVVAATHSAMISLLAQLSEHNIDAPVVMPKINAGLFRTPWERTAAALESIDVTERGPRFVTVYTLE